MASGAGQPGDMAGHYGRVEVAVTDSDVSGVILPLADLARLSWTVAVEKQDWPGNSCNCFLAPLDTDLALQGFYGATGPDGRFTIDNIVPGRYSVSLRCRPDTLYVKSASLRDGTSVQDIVAKGIDIRDGLRGTVDVVLAQSAWAVTGVVKDGEQPAPGAWVTLVPDPPAIEHTVQFRQTYAGPDGRFSIAGAAPGEYRLFAWRYLFVWEGLPATFWNRYRSQSAKVTIDGGGSVEVTAVLIR